MFYIYRYNGETKMVQVAKNVDPTAFIPPGVGVTAVETLPTDMAYQAAWRPAGKDRVTVDLAHCQSRHLALIDEAVTQALDDTDDAIEQATLSAIPNRVQSQIGAATTVATVLAVRPTEIADRLPQGGCHV
ncbi:hypothetical protein [Magnetococcus sp. PR-3]|uniref:hypothetical protein n=1 Tax=Magnetococcus sp. PR-3 TaxID=3120355 RepID=UPI002FCE09CE